MKTEAVVSPCLQDTVDLMRDSRHRENGIENESMNKNESENGERLLERLLPLLHLLHLHSVEQLLRPHSIDLLPQLLPSLR